MDMNVCISFGSWNNHVLFDATKKVSREELPKPGDTVVFEIKDPSLARFGKCKVGYIHTTWFYCKRSLKKLGRQTIEALKDELKKEGWEIHTT